MSKLMLAAILAGLAATPAMAQTKDAMPMKDGMATQDGAMKDLHGGNQERDQDRDNGNNHQQLDQGETGSFTKSWHHDNCLLRIKRY